MFLRIVTYNCQSLNCNLNVVKSLLEKSDIVLLQETLLVDNNTSVFATLSDDFNYFHTSATRNSSSFSGRSSGGLAILWRRSISKVIKTESFSERISGLTLLIDSFRVLILNVYLPCDYRNDISLIAYKTAIADLDNIIAMRNFDEILIVGDMNCDPAKGRFFKEIDALMKKYTLDMTDRDRLPPDSFTYVSSSNICSTSWLDHVIDSGGLRFGKIEIMYGETFFDHIPLYFEILLSNNLFNGNLLEESKHESDTNEVVKWDDMSDADRKTYANTLDFLVSGRFSEALSCSDKTCSEPGHHNELSDLYVFLIECMHEASSQFKCKTKSSRNVPGWNKFCKTRYEAARVHFLRWKELGCPRFGDEFVLMKNTRKDFKNAMKFVRAHELEIRKANLIEAFRPGAKSNFWKTLKKMMPKEKQKFVNIDNLEKENIVESFAEQYKEVLDNQNSQRCEISIIERSSQTFAGNHLLFINGIQAAIAKLNAGLGHDLIHSNHLKFSGGLFRNVLARLFSSLLRHSFIPHEMLRGVITPVLKDHKLNKNSSVNYRPVMLSSNLLKVFELCLFPILEEKCIIDPRQFGFRKNTGCANAISVVKETIMSYNESGSNVHAASIDLSKAFDRININTLLDKLRKACVNEAIVRIIGYMLSNTFVSVKFNNDFSNEWKVGNGVRQGGIISPLLFNVYINDLIKSIASCNNGCKLGTDWVNIICYADDMLLLAPSARGLQILVDTAIPILNELRLIVNRSKSSYIVFKHKRNITVPTLLRLDGLLCEQVNEIKYLGVSFSNDDNNSSDVDRCCNSFLRQFNSMYHKFNYLKKDMLKFLFGAYCSSFYGAENWFEILNKERSIRKIGIAYHNAIKRICGLMKWDNNHTACDNLGLPIFKHFLMKKILIYFLSVCHSKSASLGSLRHYFKNQSFFVRMLTLRFEQLYQVNDFMNNDVDALLARIDFVQRTEPRSNYVYSRV